MAETVGSALCNRHRSSEVNGMGDSSWASGVELNPRKLALFLWPFRVQSQQVKVGGEGAKG